jgi:hypothetical protein
VAVAVAVVDRTLLQQLQEVLVRDMVETDLLAQIEPMAPLLTDFQVEAEVVASAEVAEDLEALVLAQMAAMGEAEAEGVLEDQVSLRGFSAKEVLGEAEVLALI